MTKTNQINDLISILNHADVIKTFGNNKLPGNDSLPAEFYKTFGEILKTNLHKFCIKISKLGEMPRIIWQAVISCLLKRRQMGHK